MNAEEAEIYDFLKQFPNVFVSVIEISKCVGARRNYLTDRTWARPILRRMEMDGHLESSPSGDYRLKRDSGNTTTFLKALGQPNIALGDTTIICLDDVKDEEEDDQKPEKRQAR
jgi:hypothetical protein